MKLPLYLLPPLLLGSQLGLAQNTPTLELTTGQGNPTGSGPTTVNQVLTFQNNPDNPTASTFAAYSPTTTVTYALSNQQYGAGTTNPGVVFGGTTSTSTTPTNVPDPSVLLQMMGSSSTLNQYFTSASGVSGGISATDNYALQVLVNANYSSPLTATTSYQYADLTLTFNRAVVNPVLQVVGLGARSGSSTTAVGYTTDLTVLTPDVTASLLSGSKEMQVSGTQIRNTASTFSTTTNSGAASGSVLLTTPSAGISSVQLRLTLRVGANGGAATQSGNGGGDGFLLGVSFQTPVAPLPVTLVSFTAQATGPAVALRWATGSELRNDHFEVERSLDGTFFQAIGQVPGQGTSSLGRQYAFADNSLPAGATGYYRLRQVDSDGTSAYSPVQVVRPTGDAPLLSLAPNPAADALTLDLTQLPAGSYQVHLLDARGTKVLRQELPGGQAHRVEVALLPSGVYTVVVQGEHQLLHARFGKE